MLLSPVTLAHRCFCSPPGSSFPFFPPLFPSPARSPQQPTHCKFIRFQPSINCRPDPPALTPFFPTHASQQNNPFLSYLFRNPRGTPSQLIRPIHLLALAQSSSHSPFSIFHFRLSSSIHGPRTTAHVLFDPLPPVPPLLPSLIPIPTDAASYLLPFTPPTR